jgi:hypothetical protein
MSEVISPIVMQTPAWDGPRDLDPSRKSTPQQAACDHDNPAPTYSVTDPAGGTGSEGSLRVRMIDESESVFERPRRHSALECQILNEKCQKLVSKDTISLAYGTSTYIDDMLIGLF